MTYKSDERMPSSIQPDVVYLVRRMSFARRLDLMRRVRVIAPKLEFFLAGTSEQDKIDAGVLSAEIDDLYLEWGLQGIEGLEIDGVTATPRALSEVGPEELFREALRLVKEVCGLSAAEVKN
jgi:hypothetical protein